MIYHPFVILTVLLDYGIAFQAVIVSAKSLSTFKSLFLLTQPCIVSSFLYMSWITTSFIAIRIDLCLMYKFVLK